MEIRATDVKALRDVTGAGMMDAKRALVEAEGDLERAKQILREKGVARAGKLSERSAEEGVVAAVVRSPDGGGSRGALIELNCSTDFVAKTERFVDLAGALAGIACDRAPGDLEALLAEPLDGTPISDLLTEVSAEVGEPVRIRRFARFENAAGLVDAYLHQPDPLMPPKVGVLVELEGGDPAAQAGLAREVALHVAAMRPSFVSREQIPSDQEEKEREIYRNQAREGGKPDHIIDRIVEGKLKDFYTQHVLLDQPYIRDDAKTVGQLVAAEGGGAVAVRSFARFRVGGE